MLRSRNSSFCPGGSQFYACSISSAGCYTTKEDDEVDRCPESDGNLRLANYNASFAKGFTCPDGSYRIQRCPNTTPKFMGCCKNQSSPRPPYQCDACGINDLSPLILFNKLFDEYFSNAAASSSTLYSPTSSSGSSTFASAASTPAEEKPGDPTALYPYTIPSTVSIPTSTNATGVSGGVVAGTSTTQGSAASTSVSDSAPSQTAPQTATAGSKPRTAAIAGGVVGGVAGLAVLAVLLALCYRRRNRRPPQQMSEEESPVWGSGDKARAASEYLAPTIHSMMQRANRAPPGSSVLHPPPPSLLTSALPPPPAYTYTSRDNELERSFERSQSSASSHYPSHEPPSPESPPSSPPLKIHLSQHSLDRYSDVQSVSPISSHYQHQVFSENRDLEPNMYSDVSSSEWLHAHNMAS